MYVIYIIIIIMLYLLNKQIYILWFLLEQQILCDSAALMFYIKLFRISDLF